MFVIYCDFCDFIIITIKAQNITHWDIWDYMVHNTANLDNHEQA